MMFGFLNVTPLLPGTGQPDKNKPTIIYDPYGALTPPPPPRAPRPKPDDFGMLAPGAVDPATALLQSQMPEFKAPERRPTHGPDYAPQPMAPQVLDMQAFQEAIQCMSTPELNNLKGTLEIKRKQLESGPRNVAINREVSFLKQKISRVNMQKIQPKPCKMAQAPGVHPGVQPVVTTGTEHITPLGPAMPDRPNVYGAEVSASAPMLDIYQRSVMSELQREEERIRAETEALVDRFDIMTTPPTVETQMEAATVQTAAMPMYPGMAEETFIEEAQLPQTGPLAMAAAAAAPAEEGPDWVLILGGAALALLVLKKKKGRKAK